MYKQATLHSNDTLMASPILEEVAGVESSPPGTNRNFEVNSSNQQKDTNIKSLDGHQSNDVGVRDISKGLILKVHTEQNINLGDMSERPTIHQRLSLQQLQPNQ